MDTPQSDLESIRQLLADLTNRVYRIERKLQMDSPAVEHRPPMFGATSSAQPSERPAAVASNQVTPTVPAPRDIPLRPARVHSDPNLESRIGSHWFNRIGIAALLIGISYFLKFAFDNNWIGPGGRIAIGVLAGIAMVAWSERFRTRGFTGFSYSLKAVGIGTLYLSLWAASQVYSLIPSGLAFVAMLTVTAATAVIAIVQDSQLLAAFSLAGGFSTPFLLSTGQNREFALFAYVAILDLTTLAVVVFKPWPRLLVMSYAGTLLLYVGWYSRFYNGSEFNLTLAFATLFFAIFALAPLVTLRPECEIPLFASIPAVLVFVNAGAYFLQAYAMIEEVDKTYMAWFALGLAAIYIFLSRQVHHRALSPGASEMMHFLHLSVAIGFITLAIPIRLEAHWITIGWLVEAGVLLWVGYRFKSDFLNVLALSAVALGVTRLLLIDNFHTTQLLLNMRVATYAVAVAVLGAVAWYASKRDDSSARTVAAVALVALNVLALVALSREVTDSYARQITVYRPVLSHWTAASRNDFRHIEIERDFSYSALWMTYGAMLMVIGFLRRSGFVRWQSLLLIGATIGKVFVYDVSQLDREYRIISFIFLGVLLLAISFVYQRDWLQLSARNHPRKTAGESTNA